MATISNEIDIQPEARNSRLNEIVAIALVALGLLLFLCLFSYNPNDPSWNAAGESAARNWVGAVGANVAAALLQGIGLAAYLLPFSFAAFYGNLTLAIGSRFAALRLIPEKFRAWRQARRERRQQRLEMRRQAKAEAAAAGGAAIPDAVGTQMVSDENRAPTIGSGDGAEIEAAFATFSAETTPGQKTMSAAAGAGTAPAKRLSLPSRGKALEASESALVEEMVREAAVKRKTEAPATGALPFDGQRRFSTKTAASDYQLPSVELLNEAQMRREQADDELLNMSTKLAEKCREFNVTGQIKYICPGPVVTTYEFKPDPGVKYSRVTG